MIGSGKSTLLNMIGGLERPTYTLIYTLLIMTFGNAFLFLVARGSTEYGRLFLIGMGLSFLLKLFSYLPCIR